VPRAKRSYQSATRERGKAHTRDRIVRALVDVVLKDGAHAFTMQNVADRAGVALRTVYRHFESREQLLEGLSDFTDHEAARLGFAVPTDLASFREMLPFAYRVFEQMRDAMRASVIASIATGYRSRGHVARWSWLGDRLREAYPGLDAQELIEATAAVGIWLSSRTWYVLTAELGLDSDVAASTVNRGLGVLLADLEKRSRSRSQTRTRGTHGKRGRGA
jgi:AcrR family transcriptional regulator